MNVATQAATTPARSLRSSSRQRRLAPWLPRLLATTAAVVLASGAMPIISSARQPAAGPRVSGSCAVKQLRKAPSQGLRIYSYDGSQYLVNKEDKKGIAQVYIARAGSSDLTCLTCSQRARGPKANRFKMQPRWHPSGRWIILAVERDKYSPPPLLGWNRAYVEGQLQNGLWTNMFAVSPDGSTWHQLTDFTGAKGTPDGYTGPAFTPDGKTAVWSQIMDGNIFTYYPFGRWELTRADFEEKDGVPRLVNQRNITPPGMHWNEPGNFHPDNESLLFSGSAEKDAQGMDQQILNIRTNRLTNLTNSPTVWDEHGVFSPNGEHIVFMSAYPYREDPKSSKVLSIKTEFMLMNRDGSQLTQLTHFLQPGYPEYAKKNTGIAANGVWSPDGRTLSLRRLLFPNYEDWDLEFTGACGVE
jgi:Tol biopolymer transport system component